MLGPPERQLAARCPQVIDRLEQAARNGDDAYIDAVIAETLRLRTPGIFTLRRVAKPFALEDHLVLAPGTVLGLFLALVHRRPDLYPDPERFDPKRFLHERPDPYRWVPFGGGTRRCLGAAFSMLEVRTILRTMFRRARFRVATTPPEDYRRSLGVILAPRYGGRVILDPVKI